MGCVPLAETFGVQCDNLTDRSTPPRLVALLHCMRLLLMSAHG
jgi:hypothetical protein